MEEHHRCRGIVAEAHDALQRDTQRIMCGDSAAAKRVRSKEGPRRRSRVGRRGKTRSGGAMGVDLVETWVTAQWLCMERRE